MLSPSELSLSRSYFSAVGCRNMLTPGDHCDPLEALSPCRRSDGEPPGLALVSSRPPGSPSTSRSTQLSSRVFPNSDWPTCCSRMQGPLRSWCAPPDPDPQAETCVVGRRPLSGTYSGAGRLWSRPPERGAPRGEGVSRRSHGNAALLSSEKHTAKWVYVLVGNGKLDATRRGQL